MHISKLNNKKTEETNPTEHVRADPVRELPGYDHEHVHEQESLTSKTFDYT